MAATFVEPHTGQAIRIVPRCDAREKAVEYAPEARNKWEAMLLGYQRTPVLELLKIQPVVLKTPLEDLLNRPGLRTCCEICDEEVINGREVVDNGQILCRACTGLSYFDRSTTGKAEEFFSRKGFIRIADALDSSLKT